MERRIFLSHALLGTLPALPATGTAGPAQTLPAQGPLRLIVGYPAGGSADVLARSLSEPFGAELGMPVLVENRTGAGGQIAADFVRTARPDGLTVLLANMHMMVTLPLTSRSVRYDPLRDFQPVGQISSFHEVIAVAADMPARSIAQWLEMARADPARASFGVPAPGSLPQFIGYQLARDAGFSLLMTPYRGAAPLIKDLLGRQIAAGISPVSDMLPHLQAGKLHALAVNGARRAQLLAQVPTLAELGLEGFDDLEWVGLLAPPATPPATVRQLHAALARTLAHPQVIERMARLNNTLAPGTPAQLHQRMADDLRRWGPVVQESGFHTD